MRFYIGAYYLIKLRKHTYGPYNGREIQTCSTCINDSYFDDWSISWTQDGKKINEKTKTNFNLDDSLIEQVQKWSDQKFEEEKLGWLCTFSDLTTLRDYKRNFFSDVEAEILSINFPETQRMELLEHFTPKKSLSGEIGLFINLKNGIPESETEQTIGFDLIGIEESGEFHSFHCHDLANILVEKFGIEINAFGLIGENNKWNEMVEYMNDDKNGFEPVAWFYVKVKTPVNKMGYTT